MCQLPPLPPLPTLSIGFSAPVPWGWYLVVVVACVAGYYWRFLRPSQRGATTRRAIVLYLASFLFFLAYIFFSFELGDAWRSSTYVWYSAAISRGSLQCYDIVIAPTDALLRQIGNVIFLAGLVCLFMFMALNWLADRTQRRVSREREAVATGPQAA